MSIPVSRQEVSRQKRGLRGVLMVALQLLWQLIASYRAALLPPSTISTNHT